MKTCLIALLSMLFVSSALAECRRFTRMTARQSAGQFRQQCERQLPRGYSIQSIQRKIEMDGSVYVCLMCPPEPPPRPRVYVDDGCHTYSRPYRQYSSQQFRNYCMQRMPAGFVLYRAGRRISYEGMTEWTCRVCPDGDTRSSGVDRTDRSVPRGDSSTGGIGSSGAGATGE